MVRLIIDRKTYLSALFQISTRVTLIGLPAG